MNTLKKFLYRKMGLSKDIERILEAHQAQDAERMVRLFQIIPERSLLDVLKELNKVDEVLSKNVEILYLRKEKAKQWLHLLENNQRVDLQIESGQLYPYMTVLLFREMMNLSVSPLKQKLTQYYKHVKNEQKLDILYVDWDSDEDFVKNIEEMILQS